jgi:predicted methyltransferase
VLPHIRRLLESPLDSFEKLEVLTVLVHATTGTSSVRVLALMTDLPLDVIAQVLEDLRAARIVATSGGLARLTATGEMASGVREVVDLYESDRPLVAQVLAERSMDRIRGMAARAFAEAFGPRKKPGDGR